ncbi:MAG: DUF1540 domain-containing protein [Ruminococcus sp.]|nr:DUF1540 domain-containing protein [Ruminococcus sp.]
MNESNRAINCNVESCIYNKNSCECTADHINVNCTCSDPDCSDETECRTFKSREN